MTVQYVNFDLMMYVLIKAMRDLEKAKRDDLADMVKFIANALQENRDELLEDAVPAEEHDLLVRRLEHLLESDYIRSFDEKDFMTGWYKRDIREADTPAVVHGQWKRCFEDWRHQLEGDECSACGFQHYGIGIAHYLYCPNCGAKMDGGGER